MGLDMYLNAEKYVGGWGHSEPKEKAEFDALSEALKVAGMVDAGSPSMTVSFHVGYWRNANAIHRWFVDRCQDGVDECQETSVSVDECQETSVSREQLGELRAACLTVLASVKTAAGDGEVVTNPDVAESVLPTQPGFFFGSTDYDDDYLQDLKDTVKIVERALALPDCWNFSYRSSW